MRGAENQTEIKKKGQQWKWATNEWRWQEAPSLVRMLVQLLTPCRFIYQVVWDVFYTHAYAFRPAQPGAASAQWTCGAHNVMSTRVCATEAKPVGLGIRTMEGRLLSSQIAQPLRRVWQAGRPIMPAVGAQCPALSVSVVSDLSNEASAVERKVSAAAAHWQLHERQKTRFNRCAFVVYYVVISKWPCSSICSYMDVLMYACFWKWRCDFINDSQSCFMLRWWTTGLSV